MKPLGKSLASLLEVFKDIQKCMPLIQEQYLNAESPAVLRAHLYQQFPKLGAKNLAAIDWEALEPTLGADILSRDEALQTAALKALLYVPFDQSLQLLTSNEQLISVLFGRKLNREH